MPCRRRRWWTGTAAAAAVSCAIVLAVGRPVCPPPAPWSSRCESGVAQVHEDAEDFFRRSFDSLLELQQMDRRKGEAQEATVLLATFEALRLADCVRNYGECYTPDGSADEARESICGVVVAQLERLKEMSAPWQVVGSLERHGCTGVPWRDAWASTVDTVAEGLEWLRGAIQIDDDSYQRWRTGSPMGEGGPSDGVEPLLFPAELAPPGACDPRALHRPGDSPAIPWLDVSGHYTTLHPPVNVVLGQLATMHVQLSNWVVNLGASDGRCSGGALHDPANCLLQLNFSGVIYEGREEEVKTLTKLFAERPDVHLHSGCSTPASAVEAAVADGAPRSLDLLKVDVDNCDVCFVEAMLEHFDPKLIHVEIDAELPPAFSRRHAFKERGGGETNCPPGFPGSLGAFLEAVRPRYRLLYVEFVNALLVREDLADLVDAGFASAGRSDEERWRLGYFCHPLRSTWRHSPDRRFRINRMADMTPLADLRLPLEVRHALTKGIFDDEITLVPPFY